MTANVRAKDMLIPLLVGAAFVAADRLFPWEDFGLHQSAFVQSHALSIFGYCGITKGLIMLYKKAKELTSHNNPKIAEQWRYFFVSCCLAVFAVGFCVFAYTSDRGSTVSRILQVGSFLGLSITVCLLALTLRILVSLYKDPTSQQSIQSELPVFHENGRTFIPRQRITELMDTLWRNDCPDIQNSLQKLFPDGRPTVESFLSVMSEHQSELHNMIKNLNS